MGLEENKDLVRRFYAEVINGRDVEAIDDLLTEDFTHNEEPRGRPGQKAVVEAFLTGFSDLKNEIRILLAEGQLVAAHQRWTGTHDGEFMGFPPTGRQVEFLSTAILEIRGRQIASATDVVGTGSMAELLEDPGPIPR